MFRGTITLPAPIGSIKSVRLDSGKTIRGRVVGAINNPTVVVTKSDRGEWLIVGSASRVTGSSGRVSRIEPTRESIAYPFIALVNFENGGIWKGKDGKNKNLLSLPDNSDLFVNGITNLGKGKFIADWTDFGSDKFYRFENGQLTSFNFDNDFFPTYYGGGYHGWILETQTYPPNISSASSTSGASSDVRIYTRSLSETGEGHTRTYSAVATATATISPIDVEITQSEGTRAVSVTSSGTSSATVSDSLTASYPVIVRTGILGSDALEGIYTESKILSLSESASADLEYPHRFTYPFSSSFTSDLVFAVGTLEYLGTYDFSIAYTLNYSLNYERSIDTGTVEVPITDGFSFPARILETTILNESEATTGNNPTRVPITFSNPTPRREISWGGTLSEENTREENSILDFYRGIEGLALFSDFKKKSKTTRDRSLSGVIDFSYVGFYSLALSVTGTDGAYFPISLTAIPDSNPPATETASFSTFFDPIRNGFRPIELRQSPRTGYPELFFLPFDFVMSETTISEWPRGGSSGQIEGTYLVDGEDSIALNTENSFFFPVENAAIAIIPESLPATVEINPALIDLSRGAIGAGTGIVPGTAIEIFQSGQLIRLANIRQVTRQTGITTFTPDPTLPAFGSSLWFYSSRTRSGVVNDRSTVDPAWDRMQGASIAFVRKESGKIYLYRGTLNIGFADSWSGGSINGVSVAEYTLRRSIDLCEFFFESRTEIKSFAHYGIYPDSRGFLFSTDNCLNLIRAYLKEDNRKASLYRHKGSVYFAFSDRLDENGVKKSGDLWVDRYKFDGQGNFIRAKEEKGNISGLTGGGSVLNVDDISISYRP